MKSCVLLLSGGIDSVCTASLLRSQGVRVHPLFCDYGQAAAQNELHAVRFFSDQLELEKPRVLSLEIWNKENHALLNEMFRPTAGGFFLPLRNLQLAILGAVHAAEIAVGYVAFGFHASSGPLFTDTSPAFLDAVEKAFSFSLPPGASVNIWRGTCQLTKAELISTALSRGVHLEKTYSCYRASRCLECDSCRQVVDAFSALVGTFPAEFLKNRNPNSCEHVAVHE